MGDKQNQPFQLSFNASLKVDFQGSRVASDGGLILIRELDERLGFGELVEEYLTDSRGVVVGLAHTAFVEFRRRAGRDLTDREASDTAAEYLRERLEQ